MAKSTCLLALFVAVVVCAEAIRIDVPQPSPRSGKYFPTATEDDHRCKDKHNRLYPHTKDCTKYIKCIHGSGIERKCPPGLKFDTRRHCILPKEKPDCGKSLDDRCEGKSNGLYPIEGHCTRYIHCINGSGRERECPPGMKFDSIRYCVLPNENPDCENPSGPLDVDEKCPDSYGMFPMDDCHKYMVCNNKMPDIKICPEGHIYRDINGGCVPGDNCPKKPRKKCKTANQLLPDINCKKYTKCVNFKPYEKECPSGTAFDPIKLKCTKKQLENCRNNDVFNVQPDE